MPITPFHFGPAALVKGAISRYFSFIAFGLSQVLIDLEPLYYMAQDGWPIHRFFHTYAGASVAAVLVIIITKPLGPALIRLWNWRLSDAQKCWLSIKPDISLLATGIGAFFGAYSHVFLDSIMHSDMQPFAPFSDLNPLLNIIPIDLLHSYCLIFGLIGGIVLMALLFKRKMALRRDQD